MSTYFEAPAVTEQLHQPIEEAETSRLHEIVSVGKRLIGRTALVLGLATGLVVGETAVVEPRPAMADTGGYPDWNAPCVANNNNVTQGTGYWCSGYQWGYYTRNEKGEITGNSQNSSRLYGYRNCTDWVAWRIPQLGVGSVPSGWGNGGNWDNAATAAGKTVDTIPEPGDIAVWDPTPTNSYGHVAVVESVNSDGSVNISEYNKSRDGNYGSRSNVTGVSHFIDLNGTGKGINNEAWPPAASGGGGGGTTPVPRTTTVGVYDPNAAVFYLRDSNTPGPAGVSVNFGNSNWIPLSGDWDGNGTFTPGAYDPATGMFYLKDNHVSGGADRAFQYGNIGWKPIAGDWDGNGFWSVGLYDPSTGTFYLKNFNGPGGADLTFPFGNGNWVPLAGDWDGELDGNHDTTIGVYDPTTGMFYLNNENDSGAADSSFQYGNVGWTPISGDWNGNKFWSIGQYDPATSTFYLRDSNSSGPADVTVQYGNAGWKPVPGDWNGGN